MMGLPYGIHNTIPKKTVYLHTENNRAVEG